MTVLTEHRIPETVGSENFSYRIHKSSAVRIFWEGRCISTVGGTRAEKLITELENAEAASVQHRLQRETGNFTRGNERSTRRR